MIIDRRFYRVRACGLPPVVASEKHRPEVAGGLSAVRFSAFAGVETLM